MIRAAALAVALCGALAGAARAECAPGAVAVIGDWGRARFAVDVADEPAERSRGLMFVESMPIMRGMLFVYDRPQPANFWMRNTYIPLDMLFADATGTIRHVHVNARPLDETTISGGDDIQYVLEINGGLSERLGISEGDVLQHPAIGPDAAAPCE